MTISNFIPKVNQNSYIPQFSHPSNKGKQTLKQNFMLLSITKIRNDDSFVGVLMGSL